MENLPAIVEGRTASPLPMHLLRPDPRNATGTLTFKAGVPGENRGKDDVAEDRWYYSGSPQVTWILKRLFDGTFREATKTSWKAHLPGHEDLLMVLNRFPTRIGPSAQERFNEWYQEVVRKWRIQAGDLVSTTAGGDTFRGQLLQFQQEGVTFAVANRKSVIGDDTGLGKTPQGLAFMCHCDRWPAVIIPQPHMMDHWRSKLQQFVFCRHVDDEQVEGGPKLTWRELTGTRVGRDEKRADIYIVHYLTAWAWAPWLEAGPRVQTGIFDEVQELRHTGTRKYDTAAMIVKGCTDTVGLSATPTYGYAEEVHAVFNAVQPGSLGSKELFKAQFCEHNEDGKLVLQDPVGFGTYLRERGLLIRRSKNDAGVDLPKNRRIVEKLSADNRQFNDLIKEAVRIAKRAAELRDVAQRKLMEATAISAVRKATGIAKAAGIAAFVETLLEAEQPTLLFLHHHEVHDVIRRELADFNPVFLTGHESRSQKEAAREAYIARRTNLAVIALRAATGLDGFQERAEVAVIGELDWSPRIHEQCEGRVDRMGKVHESLCYYMTSDIGTDPAMMAVCDVKDSQHMGVRHEKPRTKAEMAEAERAAARHKAQILAMLRAHR